MESESSFLQLPGELRNEIYKNLLVCGAHINPRIGNHSKGSTSRPRYRALASPNQNAINSNILMTNSSIFQEANWMIYAANIFNRATLEPEEIAQFFGMIGNNVSDIEHVRVHFPFLENNEGSFSLSEYDLQILENIRSHYPKFKTITTAIESSSVQLKSLERFTDPQTFQNALSTVSSEFMSISSIEEIIVEVPEKGLNLQSKNAMQGMIRWRLKEVAL